MQQFRAQGYAHVPTIRAWLFERDIHSRFEMSAVGVGGSGWNRLGSVCSGLAVMLASLQLALGTAPALMPFLHVVSAFPVSSSTTLMQEVNLLTPTFNSSNGRLTGLAVLLLGR
jgi:hypothetical protein